MIRISWLGLHYNRPANEDLAAIAFINEDFEGIAFINEDFEYLLAQV
jgi:hypothetical protein